MNFTKLYSLINPCSLREAPKNSANPRSLIEYTLSSSKKSLSGEALAEDYICAYLRHSHPHLPEEGVKAIKSHLMSDKLLHYIASNLGVKDLVQSGKFEVFEVKYNNFPVGH